MFDLRPASNIDHAVRVPAFAGTTAETANTAVDDGDSDVSTHTAVVPANAGPITTGRHLGQGGTTSLFQSRHDAVWAPGKLERRDAALELARNDSLVDQMDEHNEE